MRTTLTALVSVDLNKKRFGHQVTFKNYSTRSPGTADANKFANSGCVGYIGRVRKVRDLINHMHNIITTPLFTNLNNLNSDAQFIKGNAKFLWIFEISKRYSPPFEASRSHLKTTCESELCNLPNTEKCDQKDHG